MDKISDKLLNNATWSQYLRGMPIDCRVALEVSNHPLSREHLIRKVESHHFYEILAPGVD